MIEAKVLSPKPQVHNQELGNIELGPCEWTTIIIEIATNTLWSEFLLTYVKGFYINGWVGRLWEELTEFILVFMAQNLTWKLYSSSFWMYSSIKETSHPSHANFLPFRWKNLLFFMLVKDCSRGLTLVFEPTLIFSLTPSGLQPSNPFKWNRSCEVEETLCLLCWELEWV